MRKWTRYVFLFVSVILVGGSVYWMQSDESDWWAGFEDPDRGFVPKFRIYWYEQLIICGVVGLFISIPITFAVYLVSVLRQHVLERSR